MPLSFSAWFSARNSVLALTLLAAGGYSARPPASGYGHTAYQISDPAEPVNRAIFAFNRSVGDPALAPVARGCKHLTDFTPQCMHNLTASLNGRRITWS
ncbi:MlaA family lipoprotein [Pseudomonas sp. KU43P]|uniref:MlaA family lipoprotein n=1 Tax=Pseudomonas sp. KU43P TaxID=2487887 RepID=UPI0012A7FFBF|nr:hypothetical protein KU43P_19940 [Pseudomonas sp. KU43P]